MNTPGIQEREKIRKDRAKKAVALAMKSRWEEAATLNRAILKEFPNDLEAYNRLGKALAELGHNRDAIDAFEAALRISPHNSIARKNLDRLIQLGEDEARPASRSKSAPQMFIEESGKSVVTSLLNIPSQKLRLQLSPGDEIKLTVDGKKLKATTESGEEAGQIEPKLASRIIRLTSGGNRYEAAVTSATDQELLLIIREVYKHPSQASTVSFPSRGRSVGQVLVPNAIVDYDLMDGEPDESVRSMIKDWSDDDTEPGDDEAFAPVAYQRIINSDGEDIAEDDY
jgi:tetratricopeptide (TPR) repeat protein